MLRFEFKFSKVNFNIGISKLTIFIYGTQVIYGWLCFFFSFLFLKFYQELIFAKIPAKSYKNGAVSILVGILNYGIVLDT